ncbi:universal stress protein [Oceanobacillus halophilus]|uniref:Universal stress protein n=1 Tax=Oceanobacillus halophilus TaxID=930130 RepID=A0A495A2Z1_9BACI|nr:universal stress protein [Oceanobacillus halophilus]RKQ33893.1 universal stress protein [Oceanobacillus halophilus]
MTTKILVAYDGSELSKQAIEEAKLQLKITPDAEVHVVTVVTISGPTTNYTIAKSITMEMADNMRPIMDRIEKDLKEEGMNVHTEVLVNYNQRNPGSKICEYADENEIDLIIVGSRGLGTMSRFFLGSVSNNIVHHAHCKVLIIR